MSAVKSILLRLGLLSLTAVAVLVQPASAGAAANAPAWSVSLRSNPTVLPREGDSNYLEEAESFSATVANVGGAPSSGPIVVTDLLPAGVEPVSGEFLRPELISRAGNLGTSYPCQVTGQLVTCEGNEAVPPSEILNVTIPVNVTSSAPDRLTNTVTVSGGGAAEQAATITSETGSRIPSFGFLEGPAGFMTQFTTDDGAAATRAGSHPYSATFSVAWPTVTPTGGRELYAVGEPETVNLNLPRGFYVNPNAVKVKCTETEMEDDEVGGAGCPRASQVGTAFVLLRGLGAFPSAFPTRPLYAIQAAPGHPAEFAFDVETGIYIHLFGQVNADGEFELVSQAPNIPAKLPLLGSIVTLWGSPTDESHDQMRGLPEGGGCIGRTPEEHECPTERLGTSQLTMPSDCPGSPLSIPGETSSWVDPGVFDHRTIAATGPENEPITVTGCNALEFKPTISAQPTTNAGDAPSGLDFNLHQPQEGRYGGLATANLKNATVTLPEGLALNPSSANGLGSCTAEQIGLTTPAGQATAIRFSERAQTCPDASKLGTAEVTTPLLEKKLSGEVFLAKPYENPFGNLISIYVAIEDPETGIVTKLAGKVSLDPQSGQLTTTFSDNPELPIEDFSLHFFNGSGSALTTPLACGNYTTASALTPWSTPEGADAHPANSFQTTNGCSASEAAAPKTVNFTAGTEVPLSAAYSPFVLRIARPDGSQHITGIETSLPEGLLGKLAGISYCPESGIEQARTREAPEMGKLEQQNPSCPASSQVGVVHVKAGSGITPTSVSGNAYLAGPYKGAPLSLVTIVPAVAGPFDLGTVVDRVALNVDEYSARIRAVADPLPTIREGIPLDVRSIELKLDRSGFTLNPTSCEAKSIEGQITTQAGQTAGLQNHFQVGECKRLAFKPSLKLSLKGPTKRSGHPALKAVLTYPKGENANIARAQVSLPHSEFLDQGNIRQACTKVLLAQHACPAQSMYGNVKAWTPLLEKPVEGPVYLVGGYGYKLPALVAELNGQIRVLLVGKIDTDKQKGIRNTFEAVPDAPVEKFVLEMKGGKKYGLLENSENICRKAQKADVAFGAQNGKAYDSSIAIGTSCKGGKKKSAHKKGREHKKHR